MINRRTFAKAIAGCASLLWPWNLSAKERMFGSKPPIEMDGELNICKSDRGFYVSNKTGQSVRLNVNSLDGELHGIVSVIIESGGTFMQWMPDTRN